MSKVIERSKGTVRYAFRESNATMQENKSKESLIILNFTYGKNRLRYSTGYKCCFNDWDFKKQRVKNKSGILNKDKVNTYLSNLQSFLEETYSELSKTHENVPKHLLKYELDVYTNKIVPNNVKQKDSLSFFQVIDEMLKQKEGNISKITERSYNQTKKRLQEFEKHHNITLMFNVIDIEFYNKFNKFMESKNYSLNTIGKHIKNLKTFLNYALTKGYSDSLEFKSSDFKVVKEITTEIYLTDDEIEAMYKKDLSIYPELEHARDVFLIGYYTGQRISDYNGLTSDDIVSIEGVQYFKIRQKKNHRYGRVVHCPITKEIKAIMKARYNGNPPHKILEKDLNENIKQVGQMLEFDKMIKCEYTKGGKFNSKMIPKYNLIKSHTARRSFCTNKYKAGMSIYDIMLFSGHTTEKEFYKYIRIKDEDRASHIVKSGYFNI